VPTPARLVNESLTDETPHGPSQHVIITGLGRADAAARVMDAKRGHLAWQITSLEGRTDGIRTAGDFWLRALQALDEDAARPFAELGHERREAYALEALRRMTANLLMVHVPDFDRVLQGLQSERHGWALRKALSGYYCLVLVGTAADRRFMTEYDEPFYGYFYEVRA